MLHQWVCNAVQAARKHPYTSGGVWKQGYRVHTLQLRKLRLTVPVCCCHLAPMLLLLPQAEVYEL
jgi:hypothetical protein